MSGDRERKEKYAEKTVEELEQQLRETFFYTDKIDDTVYMELEQLREALEEKRPMEPESAEAFWERFEREHGEELDRCCAKSAQTKAAAKTGRFRSALRIALIAAAVVVLLAGAVLAAGPRLWAWVRGWDSVPAAEVTEGPIRKALEDYGIMEPVYPSYIPLDFVLTEAYISGDPLLLSELYTRGDRFLSITVTSVSAADKALYPRGSKSTQEYEVGETAHYLFSNDGSITAVWHTENCFVSISGNITIRSLKRIIDSVYANEGGIAK